MPYQLTIHPADASPTSASTSLLFDQQTVTIGRAKSNDVVVLDPKVSKEHATIELAATGHHVIRDRKSKNATFIDEKRVAPPTPTLLVPNAEIQVGDTVITYTPLVPATAERTRGAPRAEGDAESRSWHEQAGALADRLIALAREVNAEAGANGESTERATLAGVVDHLRTRPAAWAALQRIVASSPSLAGRREEREGRPRGDRPEEAMLGGEGSEREAGQEPEQDAWGALPSIMDDVLSLPSVLWEHLDTPPPVQDNIFLRASTPDGVRSALEERREHGGDELFMQLCRALQYVVVHHYALLHGYQDSIEEGGQALLRRISPRESVPNPGKTGVFMRVFGGKDSDVGWERLERQWRKLYHSDWGHVEQKLFRPAFLSTYQAHMQAPRDALTSPLCRDKDKKTDEQENAS
ncbi:MAG: FHA domain-containing protein [Longimonas sp.]|uniref:FHA domain-containing protein n=1 Tax=Longimonas sp. TaxID=2039626 RepID=UPI00334B9096